MEPKTAEVDSWTVLNSNISNIFKYFKYFETSCKLFGAPTVIWRPIKKEGKKKEREKKGKIKPYIKKRKKNDRNISSVKSTLY